MRVRIIFRGLTLFTFSKGSTQNAKEGDNLGELTAWLVSDPSMNGHPGHEHIPRLSTMGRESHTGVGRAQLNREFPREMRVALSGHDAGEGVTVSGSFLDYVPRLGALNQGKAKGIQDRFITRKIVIPSGRIRARDFISWEWHGSAPARVAFMDTSHQGFVANEVVVDIGDDSDPDGQDKKKFVTMESGKTKKRYWSFAKESAPVDSITPNAVEFLVTNAAARRSTSLFWGLHMMSLFDAAGYDPKPAYENVAQFEAFERAAMEYDADEWQADKAMMGIGHPFPFLIIDPAHDKLEGIRDVGQPYIIPKAPPYPEGQSKRTGRSASAMHMDHMNHMKHMNHVHPDDKGHTGHGGGPSNDPANIILCPMGVI